MRPKLIINIGCLINVRTTVRLLRGKELAELPVIFNAYLAIDDGFISRYGHMEELTERGDDIYSGHEVFDAAGGFVLPSWCDSHTHLVFAASRESEFIDKIRGISYAEIAAKGGGILNSAEKLNLLSENELFDMAKQRLLELIRAGTGAIEIKSGYGLTIEGELKMLRVIRRLKELSLIPVKATFLGAHAYPRQFRDRHEKYIKMIVDEMLPNISREGLADFVDIFCEEGFFTVEEMIRICEAASRYQLKPKVHVNQLNSIGGVAAAVKMKAISADHLEVLTENDIEVLSSSGTIATMLPTAAFFLRACYPPARALIDAGAAVAVASDYNPGSSPSGNMNFVISISCIQMRMLPEEAVNAATINGAFAMELGESAGSIALGRKANLIITFKVPSLAYLPYSFGTNLIRKVMVNGIFVE